MNLIHTCRTAIAHDFICFQIVIINFKTNDAGISFKLSNRQW